MLQHMVHYLMKRILSILLIAAILVSCRASQTTMLISDSYDETKDMTSLMLFPYGNINIPGKWTKTSYNETSKQHYFRNDDDSTSIAVTMNPMNKYPFHSDSLTYEAWVTEFYKWESEYYRNQGYTTEILKSDNFAKFLIWKITGENVNTVFLFGCKGGYAINYAVFTNLSDNQRISFLTQLYEHN